MRQSMGGVVLVGVATGVFAQAPAASSAASAATGAVMHGSMACSPNMPVDAAEARAQGTSKIRFHVDETGKVVGAEIMRSTGQSRAHRLLDNAAMRALAQCPFTPGRDAGGQPVASYVDVSYTWKIE